MLVQIGYYLRNTRAIHQIPPPARFRRVRLLPSLPWVRQYESRVRAYWQRRSGRREYAGVLERGFVSRDDYEHLLRSAVVLTEVFDASANNVVLECIGRETPIAINRHPAVVEHLGPDYPLYFDSPLDVPDLLREDRVLAAHYHLRTMDKENLRGDVFRDCITEAMDRILAAQRGRISQHGRASRGAIRYP